MTVKYSLKMTIKYSLRMTVKYSLRMTIYSLYSYEVPGALKLSFAGSSRTSSAL